MQALLTAVGLVGFTRDWLAHRPIRHVDWVETIAGTLGFVLIAWSASHSPRVRTTFPRRQNSRPHARKQPATTQLASKHSDFTKLI